jgi:hypothetical protein
MAKVLDDINFFGAVDRKGKRADGKITSEYPAFYFHTQFDELKENTERAERQLKLGLVPASEVPYAQAEVERNRQRMIDIKKANPQLEGRQKDAVFNMYKELASQISDSMYTRSDMKKGLVDAHEEARRMSQPIISIKGNEKFFHNMGITATGGKISRNEASRAYKIMGKALGENTNTEHLRRDRKTGTFSIGQTLQEMLDK